AGGVLALGLELHVLGHFVAFGGAEADRDEAILIVETHDLRRDDLAGLEHVLGLDRHGGADLATGHGALDALLELDAGAVRVGRHDAQLEGRSLGVAARDERPRMFVGLRDAQADLLLLVVDGEDDRLDLVALAVEVGRVVDALRPAEVRLVDHAVDALFDADEHAVIGERADLALDDVARVVLLGEDGPGIGLELLEAEGDALVLRVDVEDDGLDLLAELEDLRGVLGLGPGHLADVDEALDALLELDERAVVGERDDLA